jgi:hypothetical protein
MQHSTFPYLFDAVRELALGSGRDVDKLERIRWLFIGHLHEDDFILKEPLHNPEQLKLFREIKDIYLKHPHFKAIKIPLTPEELVNSTTISLHETHWRVKKKLKSKILDLFYEIL